MIPKLLLKKGRDAPIRDRHMWIFSGAVEKMQSDGAISDGDVVEVLSHDQTISYGYAVINSKSNILGRIISYTTSDLDKAVEEAIIKAYELRRSVIPHLLEKPREMYRLVNAEGDMMSGLVIDMYGAETAVLQISSLAMERAKNGIVKALKKVLGVSNIYERSESTSRKIEGLPPVRGHVIGSTPERVWTTENDIEYVVDIQRGQKTGFFLDQREMRLLIRSLSQGKKVVNCFSYSGGFSLNALLGGAEQVVSIDASQDALSLLGASLARNSTVSSLRHQSLSLDVFSWLSQGSQELDACDILILDPPAFAKTQKDVSRALHGYREINRRALQRLKKGALLLTCSCSYHVSSHQFYEMLYKAACDAKRDIRILSYHRTSLDHPSTIFHRETEYLKSVLLAAF